MDKIIKSDNLPVPLILRRNRRLKRLSMRVATYEGKIIVNAPLWCSQLQIDNFIIQNKLWARDHFLKQPKKIVPELGGKILLDGQYLNIVEGCFSDVTVEGSQLFIPPKIPKVSVAIANFLKTLARNRFEATSRSYAKKIGAEFYKLYVRDTRSRWGSCSSKGKLMYSWRLIMAPKNVQNYVAAHEVCHLRVMNHSSDFWHLVSQLCPPYKTDRLWLRNNGAQLHKFQF